MTTPLSFDRIVAKGNGVAREFTVPQFLELTVFQRIRYLLEGQLAFYQGSAEVDRALALKELMERQRASRGQ